MGNKIFPVMLISSLCFLMLSGCWDEVEIEDYGFVAGIAIDLADEQEGGRTRFKITEQLVVPAGLGTITQSDDAKAFRNLSQTGESIYDISRKVSRQSNRVANVEHLGLIIISSEIAEREDLFAHVLDVFTRYMDIRRGIEIVIADKKAADLLEVEPEHVKLPANYIIELSENESTAITMESARVGDIQEKLLVNRSFAVPLLTIYSNNSIDYGGVAVFHGDTKKQVGSLILDEAKGLHFITGRVKQGTITTDVDGDLATFEFINVRSNKKLLNNDKNQLVFQVDIKIKANLREFYGMLDFSEKDSLRKLGAAVEDEVKRLAENTLKKAKNDLQVDVLGFGKHLRIYHNQLWEEIKDDWETGENYFSQSEVTINVKANITESGALLE